MDNCYISIGLIDYNRTGLDSHFNSFCTGIIGFITEIDKKYCYCFDICVCPCIYMPVNVDAFGMKIGLC
ncbi:hypothetical protein BANRA_05109 [Escherichia coli]|nr:hypothetical protein BANRA_05109 [Escherichia coli]